jgi:hypothetical protein
LVGDRRELHDNPPSDPIPRFSWSRLPAIAARKEAWRRRGRKMAA